MPTNKPLKILVVEDDKFLASAYRAKLTQAGFVFSLATDGAEALETLAVDIPDLILLDLVMPRKDGFATLAEVKDSEKLRHIPVIVASNLGQKEDIDKALQMGAEGYIVKSDLSLDELIEKIQVLLQQKASRKA